MDKKNSVSAVLLLFKPGVYLKPCLESILSQSRKDFELLIIDNASEDGTVARVQKLMSEFKEEGRDLPVWRLIANENNLGFSAGENQGIKTAEGEIIFLVNQDVILDRDYFKNIADVFEENRAIGSAQGKLLRLKADGGDLLKTDRIDNAGLVMLKNRRIIARGQGEKDSGQFEEAQEIFGADGAAPAFRKAVLEDVKIPMTQIVGPLIHPRYEYFDEDFFTYKEDVDLAWRIRLAGWKSFYEPKAVAWHARTAGDSAATNYFSIIRERLKINKLGKYHAFKNQRLMQIKNEQPGLLLRHFLWFLPKEIGAWLYVLVFERYTWRAMKELFKLAPSAWRKRKIIMAKRRASVEDMRKWFK